MIFNQDFCVLVDHLKKKFNPERHKKTTSIHSQHSYMFGRATQAAALRSAVDGIPSLCKQACQLYTEEAGVTPLYAVKCFPAQPCKPHCEWHNAAKKN